MHLTPSGRMAMTHRATQRYTSITAKELDVKARSREEGDPLILREDSTFAAKKPKRASAKSSKAPDTSFNNRDGDGKRR